ncbi:midnolin homolog [Uloborus diversus]|uniref:midnolin homolog n=1 Tax=Uloborus diversus TaxID=327109 RepID=UPI00240954D4|nr:midnolin homolog [Uloborus diversus]
MTQLVEGSLEDNNIAEGSKLTLLPNVETGLMTQNPEQCVMQALETLNESQVDNFLAGRSPLNLTMRLGDHMMFIQLQLSTVSTAPHSSSPATTSSPPTPPTTPTSTSHPDSPSPFSAPPVSAVSSSITSMPSPPPSPKCASPSDPRVPAESSNSISNKVFTEATRNLTQTLKQLSSSALTKKMNESCDGRCCVARRQGGAVIESMFHHGRGVFSGTFSGTLSPLLQDKNGRPRRNICTVIHILNDLLGASSHCNPSAQCLCSTNTPAAQSKLSKTAIPSKVKDEDCKQDEDKVLREKVQHIQTMLKERRQNRRVRREERSSPYSSDSKVVDRKTLTHPTSSFDSNGVFCSTLSSDCSDQKCMDYSSETAVA